MKQIATIIATLFIVNAAAGQITLDESTIQALIGKRLVDVSYDATDTTGTMALYMQAGENQTWDITSYGWTPTDTFSIDFLSSAVGTPGENDPDFASANLIQVSSFEDDTSVVANASYTEFDNTGLRNLGHIFVGYLDDDMVLDTSKSVYTPPEQDIPFPFTFGSMVSDSVTHSQFVADTLVFQEQNARDGEVDGWGTLITPNGSYDVLRFKYEERSYFGGFGSVSTTVEWWGTTGPIFQISMEDFFGISDIYVSYSTQTITEITAIDPSDFELPTNFALNQNYPNPFNPSTMIPFELQEASSVKLVVFDMLGRQVETLVDGYLPVGLHQVPWTPESLTGGMYVAQIEVNGRKQARTMTLLK